MDMLSVGMQMSGISRMRVASYGPTCFVCSTGSCTWQGMNRYARQYHDGFMSGCYEPGVGVGVVEGFSGGDSPVMS